MQKRVLVFIGAASSGKGTQADLISRDFNLHNISSGKLCRKEAAKDTERGRAIKSLIEAGNMIPDGLMFELLEDEVANNLDRRGFVFDGVPRNIGQCELLDMLLKKYDLAVTDVFVIDVPRDVLVKRISGRFECRKCGQIYNTFYKKPKVDGVCDVCGSGDFTVRADDADVKSVEKRLDIFDRESGGVKNFYDKKGLIYRIDGIKSIDAIHDDIKKSLLKVNN